MIMTKEYPCPYCEDEIIVDGNDTEVTCKSCGINIRISYDAEFIDGVWKDLTTLKQL